MNHDDFNEGDEIKIADLVDRLTHDGIYVELGREIDIHYGPAIKQLLLHTAQGEVIIGSCLGIDRKTGEKHPVLYFMKLAEPEEPSDDQIANRAGMEGGIPYDR